MVVNTVIKRPDTNPTDVRPATAMNVVAPLDLLDEDTTIGTLLDIRVTLRPPLQEPFLSTLRPDQRVLLAGQLAMR